jgi:hypothetical protein
MTPAAALRISVARIAEAVPRRTCSKCGGTWPEAFYRQNRTKNPVGQVYLAKHSVCVGCELTARNEPTPPARALRKAHNSISHHASEYALPAPEFAKLYGWKAERMQHDVLHASENTCCYCWTPYREMGHGLSDLTFDIIDRLKPPHYHTNVRVCCLTCNREKATLPPEVWAQRLVTWPQYQDWIKRIGTDQTHGLPLFGKLLLSGFVAWMAIAPVMYR